MNKSWWLGSPLNPHLYTVCTCLAVVKLWDYYQQLLLMVSWQLAVVLTDDWDTKPNCQKGSIACKIPSEILCAMLISVLWKNALSWQRGGWSEARTAACPLCSRVLRHREYCAAIKRSMTEVPGPLSAPLVVEAPSASASRGSGCWQLPVHQRGRWLSGYVVTVEWVQKTHHGC